jgi:AcrR family transcriptional regulator
MTTQARGEETRTRILEAAVEAFARHSYDATGVAEICQRAGVTKGGFYHHFPSKQALFLEMLDQWLEGLDSQIEAVRSGSQTVPEDLMGMTGMVRAVFRDAGGRLPIFLEFLAHAGRSPEVWQATVGHFCKYDQFFADLVREGIQEGSLGEVDPEITSRVLLSFAIGLLAQGLLDPFGADWAEVAREGMAMLIKGSRAPERNGEWA